MNGYQDCFYWGFTASKTNYFLNPSLPRLLGTLAAPDEDLLRNISFCGQSLLYSGLPSASDTLQKSNPSALFIQYSRVSTQRFSIKNIDFQSIAAYDYALDSVETVDSMQMGIFIHPVIGNLSNCLQLTESPRASIKITDWDVTTNIMVKNRFIEVKETLPDFSKLKRSTLVNEIAPFRSQSLFYTSRGIVIPVDAINLGFVVRTILLLRRTGCKLPLVLTYFEGKLTDGQIIGLNSFRKKFMVTLLDLTPRINHITGWSDNDVAAALRIQTIISVPFDEVLFINADRDILFVQDPTFLFKTHAFQSHGALFWTEMKTRDINNPLWEILESESEKRPGLVVSSKHLVVNKKKIWKALHMALFLISEGDYYKEVR